MSNDLIKRSKWRIVEMYSMLFNIIGVVIIGFIIIFILIFELGFRYNIFQGPIGWFLLLSAIILDVMGISLIFWSFLTPIRHYWTHSETQEDISSRGFSIVISIMLLMLYLVFIQVFLKIYY